jgi:hypothetical protein
VPDLGILKGLSSMSAAAKNTLSNLAVRFAQTTTNSSSSGSGNNRNYGEKGTDKEFKPFVASKSNVFFFFIYLFIFYYYYYFYYYMSV